MNPRHPTPSGVGAVASAKLPVRPHSEQCIKVLALYGHRVCEGHPGSIKRVWMLRSQMDTKELATGAPCAGPIE